MIKAIMPLPGAPHPTESEKAALRGLSGQTKDRAPEEWRRWWRETGERELVH